jgi:hypothetical protein
MHNYNSKVHEVWFIILGAPKFAEQLRGATLNYVREL